MRCRWMIRVVVAAAAAVGGGLAGGVGVAGGRALRRGRRGREGHERIVDVHHEARGVDGDAAGAGAG